MNSNQAATAPNQKSAIQAVPNGAVAVQNFEMMPKSYNEFWQFSSVLASSDLVPKDYRNNPANVMVAVTMGAELGLKPMQALQNIAVINGRPSLWGDAVLALIQGSGLLQDFREWTEGTTAYCMMHRKGYSESTTRSFSDADAQAAGLLNKQGPWTQYRARMRQMRARGFCARDLFADLLRGLNVAEEAMDIELESVDGKTFAPRATPVVVQPTVPEYNAEDFAKNFPLWQKTIEAGKKAPEDIIALVESKAKLTDAQKAQILALKKVDAQPAVTGGVQ